jgi:acetyl-CoA carboxylase biotin carboxyl carrier protein
MNAQEMQELAGLLQQIPGIKSIELRDVKKLADLLRQSPEIGSIEVNGWFGSKVVITRTNSGVPSGPAAAAAAAAAAAPVQAYAVPAASPAPEAPPETASAPAVSHLKAIKSPMVGTFYKAPEPGAEAYVQVGGRVSPGQTVCIVEAMKIMNEIESELAGVVKEVCVEDGKPVEYGEVLYRVDPNG